METRAGWYQDPASAEGLRYWDGPSWTQRTSPGRPSAPSPENAARSDASTYGKQIVLTGVVIWVVSRVCALSARAFGSGRVDDVARALGGLAVLVALSFVVVGGVLWIANERKRPRRAPHNH